MEKLPENNNLLSNISSAADTKLTTREVVLLREILLQAIVAESEDRWAAGWMDGIEEELYREGGKWEGIGRLVGWPKGYMGEEGWYAWDKFVMGEEPLRLWTGEGI